MTIRLVALSYASGIPVYLNPAHVEAVEANAPDDKGNAWLYLVDGRRIQILGTAAAVAAKLSSL